MPTYHNSKEKPSSWSVKSLLLVLMPATLFSLFIGGVGLSLIAGGLAPARSAAQAGSSAAPAQAVPASSSAVATAPPVPTLAPTPASPPPASAPVDTGASPAVGDLVVKGQQVYMMTCVACHQPTGTGLPGTFPSLAGSSWLQAESPSRVIAIVLHGLQGPITINNQAFNTPMAMAPLGIMLKDDQIAAVLTYVRSSFGNNASPVTVEQVTAIREKTKGRAGMWTQAELEKELPQ